MHKRGSEVVKDVSQPNRPKSKKRRAQYGTDIISSSHASSSSSFADEQQATNSDAVSASPALQVSAMPPVAQRDPAGPAPPLSQMPSLAGQNPPEHLGPSTVSTGLDTSNLDLEDAKDQPFTLAISTGDHPSTETRINLFEKHMKSALLRRGVAFLKIIGELVGVSTVDSYVEKEIADGEYCSILAGSIKTLMKAEGSRVPDTMNNDLMNICGEFAQMAMEGISDVEGAVWQITNHLQIFLLKNLIASSNISGRMEEQLLEIRGKLDAFHPQPQAVLNLPCANSAYEDYTSKDRSRASCFEGTRKELLKEVIDWFSESDTNIYVLFGLAGIGKSTITQTVAEKADKIGLLGGGFFFSRNEAERRTARLFFTTITFQLCAYDSEFAEAIESVLLTEAGKDAIRKGPLEQLDVLILGPLTKLAPRKVVIVVDALDECDDDDGPTVLMGLNKLVQSLPLFKVMVTTRPQQHIELLLNGLDAHKAFHLHTIDDNVVDSDVRLYLKHNLSLEAVQGRFRDPTKHWSASDEEIELLVKAAGRLFVIASISVLFVLDIDANNPEYRMKQLLAAIAQDRIPFEALNDFYTVILRSALPKDSDVHAVAHYQTVIGTIILIFTPLTIEALANLTGCNTRTIHTLLAKLKSVILPANPSDTPLFYHKSFLNYIQDPACCKAEDLRIDTRSHHTRLAIHCLQSLNRRLKQNIMDLDGVAIFMPNDEALKEQGLTDNHVEEKIPPELRYVCLYFAHHIESGEVEDAELAEELDRLVNERLLNWLEALSWIGKLDTVHRPLLIIEKLLKSISPDIGQVVTDALRFIGKFYEDIKTSALYTYRSALPFIPTESSLYKRYTTQMMFCRVQGAQEGWDGLVFGLPSAPVDHVIFSSDSTLSAFIGRFGPLKVHDAAAGIPLGKIESTGKAVAIAHNFSKAAALDDGSITLYNVKGITPVAHIKPYTPVVDLALSPNGSRLVAAGDNVVGLWDTEKCEQIDRYGEWIQWSPIVFSFDGSRMAYACSDGVIKLIDGTNGKIVADLSFPLVRIPLLLSFSADSSRLACLALGEQPGTLKVWNSRNGMFMGAAEGAGYAMAISTDGSLLATGDFKLMLWSGNNLALLDTLDLGFKIQSLAISQDGLLGIAFECNNLVALYDINSHIFIARLPIQNPLALAFSPDCARLAVGSFSLMQLWDIPSIRASGLYTSQGQSSPAYELDFSPDCSRLASAHRNGTIKLWDTSNMTQPIITHKYHLSKATTISFSADGEQFASWWGEGFIQLWNGKDGASRGVLNCSGELREVALSGSMLAAATDGSITLWDLQTRTIIATLDQRNTCLLAISHHHSLLAAVSDPGYYNSALEVLGVALDNLPPSAFPPEFHVCELKIWDTAKRNLIITYKSQHSKAKRMSFLPDDAQLAIQFDKIIGCRSRHFQLLNTSDGETSEVSEIHDIGLLPSWNGLSVEAYSKDLYGASFAREKGYRRVLSCPFPVESSATGSSMIALGCTDGRILLIKGV